MYQCAVVDPIGSIPPDVLDDLAEKNYFTDIVSQFTPREQRQMQLDLDLYERTGWCSDMVADVFRRAQCIAQAERILAKLG